MKIFGIRFIKETMLLKSLQNSFNTGKDAGLRHNDKIMSGLLDQNTQLRKKLYGERAV